MNSQEENYRIARDLQIDRVFMNIAKEIATLSHATKAKVGSIIVGPDKNIIGYGFNGTPAGFDNKAEHEVDGKLKTKPEVIHSESNSIAKLARSTQSSKDSVMYVTLSPCLQCSKLIAQAGITTLVYMEDWKDSTGLEFLKKCNITVKKLKPDNDGN